MTLEEPNLSHFHSMMTMNCMAAVPVQIAFACAPGTPIRMHRALICTLSDLSLFYPSLILTVLVECEFTFGCGCFTWVYTASYAEDNLVPKAHVFLCVAYPVVSRQVLLPLSFARSEHLCQLAGNRPLPVSRGDVHKVDATLQKGANLLLVS